MKIFNLLLLIFLYHLSFSQSYNEKDVGIPVDAEIESFDFADFDNDGDLDLLTTGRGSRMVIYRNDSGMYVDSGILLPGIDGEAKWGDFNNDGLLDIAAAGYYGAGFNSQLRIMINNGDNSFDIFMEMPEVSITLPNITWVDLDNDNDLDLFIVGEDIDLVGDFYAVILENNEGLGFTKITDHGIVAVGQASVDWADYNHDGYDDLLLAGFTQFEVETKIFTNNGNLSFSPNPSTLTPMSNGTSLWFDFDEDNDLDIISTGRPQGGDAKTIIYTNEEDVFSDNNASTTIGLPQVGSNFPSGVSIVDYDNDSDLDIFISGRSGSLTEVIRVTEIYENKNNGDYQKVTGLNLDQDVLNNVIFFDYDNDGDKDFFFSDRFQFNKLNQNTQGDNTFIANSKPTAPTILLEEFTPSGVVLSWNEGADAESPSTSLTYNYYLSTNAGGYNAVSPMSNINTGQRKLPNRGNAVGNSSFVTIDDEGYYYWGVQSIDDGLTASTFSSEKGFYFLLGTTAEATILNNPYSVILNWVDNSEIEDEYVIEKSYDNDEFTTIEVLPMNTESYIDMDNILAETPYFYKISSRNSTTTSSEASAYVVIPNTPGDFGLSANGNINLNWEDLSEHESNYIVQRKRSTVHTFSTLPAIPSNSNSYTDSIFTSEGIFQYRIYAKNQFGRSDYSVELETEYLFAPSFQETTIIHNESPGINLVWSDNSQLELGYSIKLASGNVSFEEVAVLDPDETEVTLRHLETELIYTITVEALGNMNNSVKDTTSVVIPAGPTALTLIRDSTLFVSWDDNTAYETGYVIERSYQSESNFMPIDTVNATKFEIFDQELPEGLYFYRVYALSELGRSTFSNIVSHFNLNKPNITGTKIKNDPLRVEIDWTDNSSFEDSYVLEKYSEDSVLISSIPLQKDVEEYYDYEVTVETPFIYHIAAVNGTDRSDYDSDMAVIPDKPSNLEISIENNINLISLSWDDNSNFETGYQIERGANKSEFKIIGIVNAATSIFQQVLPSPTTEYSYRIAPFNEKGIGEYSEILSVIITSTENISNKDIKLFPNPVENNYLVISPFDTSNNYEIKVLDLEGRVLMVNARSWLNDSKLTVDVSTLEGGNYLVLIKLKNKSLVYRFNKL